MLVFVLLGAVGSPNRPYAAGSDGTSGGRMFGVAQRHGRGLLILTAVVAVVVSACGGTTLTAAPPPTPAPTPPPRQPPAPSSPGNGGPILAGASDALASLTSYKFHMTQAGTDSVNKLADIAGNASSASTNGSVTFSGTVILKPAKAVEVTTTGLHVIFVGGFDYMDVGNAGAFAQIAADSTSISDPFTPAQVFSDPRIRISGYSNVGSETKNDVPSDHYQAGASDLAELRSEERRVG